MPALLVVVAVLGGLAFWRRKSLGSDAKNMSSKAKKTVHDLRSHRRALIGELGELMYKKTTGETDDDLESNIARVVGELVRIDAESKASEHKSKSSKSSSERSAA